MFGSVTKRIIYRIILKRIIPILFLFTKTYLINNFDKIPNAYLEVLYTSHDIMVAVHKPLVRRS